jgi:hypothetical protein
MIFTARALCENTALDGLLFQNRVPNRSFSGFPQKLKTTGNAASFLRNFSALEH